MTEWRQEAEKEKKPCIMENGKQRVKTLTMLKKKELTIEIEMLNYKKYSLNNSSQLNAK